MANPKIEPITTWNFISEYKPVASQDVVIQKSQKNEFFFSSEQKSSQIYFSVDSPNSEDFDKWCSHVDSLAIDFKKEFNPSIEALQSCQLTQFNYWGGVLLEFMAAIKDYTEQQNEFSKISCISTESAKRFLFLVPVLAAHKPHVYIDASNGCFNVDMPTRDNGILSTQISENGQIHYSYVAQNKKIFKITGTAKFKDSKDFIKFNKVLKML